VTLTFGLLTFVTWCHLGGQSLYQAGYDLPFQSWDDYNFPLTAYLKSNFYVFGVKGSNFIFLTPKGTTLARTTYNNVLCVGMCQKMWLVGVMKKREKKDRTFHASNRLFAQITSVDVASWILRAGLCPGSSYIFQVSWKSVQGSRSCGGSKIALSHWQAPWFIQQLVLLYKPW